MCISILSSCAVVCCIPVKGLPLSNLVAYDECQVLVNLPAPLRNERSHVSATQLCLYQQTCPDGTLSNSLETRCLLVTARCRHYGRVDGVPILMRVVHVLQVKLTNSLLTASLFRSSLSPKLTSKISCTSLTPKLEP